MVCLVLFAVCFVSASSAAELSLRGARGITNVWFGKSQLTHFKNPHHIYEPSISPSGNYALVWHMDFPPRKMMTFDLRTKKMIAEFSPGVAGQLDWTAEDRIVIFSGCGSSCVIASIFDLTGKQTFGYDKPERAEIGYTESCEIVLHPSRRALVIMPQSPSAPFPLILLRTSDNAVSRIDLTNAFCLDWHTNRTDFDVTITTNNVDYEPRQKISVTLPKEWRTNTNKW
jgi:hypothetical protein